MGRTRQIKPDIFKNGELWELGPEAVLFFIALWQEADRDGRLEDRPLTIRATACPLLTIDPDKALWGLHSRGLILRYTAGGIRYIQIVNFAKHQSPHKDEKPSSIPPLDGFEPPCCQKRGSNLSWTPATLNGTPVEAQLNALASTEVLPRFHSGTTVEPRCFDSVSTPLHPMHPSSHGVVEDSSVLPSREAAKKADVGADDEDDYEEFDLPETHTLDELRRIVNSTRGRQWAAFTCPNVNRKRSTDACFDNLKRDRNRTFDNLTSYWKRWMREDERRAITETPARDGRAVEPEEKPFISPEDLMARERAREERLRAGREAGNRAAMNGASRPGKAALPA